MLAGLFACTPQPADVTQAIVAVNADPPLAAKLKALKVLLYPLNALDENKPSRVQVLPFVSDDAGARAYRLPLSFGITHERADQFELVIKGCVDGPECAEVIIEHKQFVRFVPRASVQVSVLLTSACDGSATRCAGLRQTCAALDGPAGVAGSCVPVPEALREIVQPGDELLPTPPAPSADAGGGGPDADANANAPEAGLDGDDAGAARSCPSDNRCLAGVYPCLPDQGQGYVCRGQFADWPMPDFVRDGGVVPRYDVSTPGVVHDQVTGLRWEQKTPSSYPGCSGRRSVAGDTCTWAEAKAYCEGLALAGLGWRVPTKIELESLLDFRPTTPTLDPALFFFTAASLEYWTSSPGPNADIPNRAFTVEFLWGRTTWEDVEVPLPVRCVHSDDLPVAALGSRYVVRQGEGVIGDVRTGLLWSAVPLCEPALSYEAAAAFCPELSPNFRVPSAKELLTLVDPTRYEPAIDPVFAATPASGLFWSSTPAKDTDGQWLVFFKYGFSMAELDARAQIATFPDGGHTYCVRCVQ